MRPIWLWCDVISKVRFIGKSNHGEIENEDLHLGRRRGDNRLRRKCSVQTCIYYKDIWAYLVNINVQVKIKKINKSEYWNSLYHHRDRVLVNSVLYWTESPLRAENLPSIIFTFHFPDMMVELLPWKFYMYHIFKVVLSNLSFDPEQSLVKSFSRLDRKPAERKT